MWCITTTGFFCWLIFFLLGIVGPCPFCLKSAALKYQNKSFFFAVVLIVVALIKYKLSTSFRLKQRGGGEKTETVSCLLNFI